MTLSMLSNVLVSLTFISITYYKGTAIYPEETFSLEMISVELMVLANVPLALTFLSIVMKLDKTKRRVSLYGIVVFCFIWVTDIHPESDTCHCIAICVGGSCSVLDSHSHRYSSNLSNVEEEQCQGFFFQFRFSRYIFIPITLSIYLLYDIPAEAGLITASFSIDIFWAFMWKHRVEVYMICILNWGLVYVLFNKNRFLYCYQKPLSLCMSQDAIRKINKDQNKEQNNL
ncbi:hypothetical protein C9374_004236 [Naegleria lovaniensis]|uniref:Uncharacterized protein n=1 Tax=Naegleria lovaniensis TaxID=51637 RepID=A0AA88GSZ7_NAELO|nr:uncharacterized protein C9374_004236 [Naegleria lovaniensis]KAG2383565.1 hypothetical protein C9374_004236 [Naegleria lovaniensis]